LRPQRERYRTLVRQLRELELRINSLRKKSTDLQSQLRGHQFLEKVHAPWSRVRDQKRELAGIPDLRTFPTDGLSRLARLEADRDATLPASAVRRVGKTTEFTIMAISELESEIETDRQMIIDYPDQPIYAESLADGQSRLTRLLAGEDGMERLGVEHCLFVPKPTATRADAEAQMTRWFRRNGERRPIRYRWQKADWFPIPATVRA